MKTKFEGSFLGTGAGLYIGLGFVPDWVYIANVGAADFARIEWNRLMGAHTTHPEGIKTTDNSGTPVVAELTVGTGVIPYYGGDIATGATSKIVPVGMVSEAYARDQRNNGAGGLIDTWTLDTSGNRTGHFNAGVNTSYAGAGSRVRIAGKWYNIVAITNDGDAADEITLDQAAPTGAVEKISPKVDLAAAPSGLLMPQGIYLAETAALNVSAERCMILAGSYEQ